ncbi:MAG: PQQ-binding-like beta-propeller repeat protein [Planctomycetes bacterium]|nr:PQQ-binding-like beta-propeller repeat protein [Planctomycetota bacterium]
MRITSHFTACAACILTLTAASAIFVSGQALRFGDADLPAYDPTNFAANNSDFIATQLLTAKNHIKEAASVEPGPEQDRIYRLAAEALQEVLNTGNLHEQVVRSGDEHERWTGALENCESIIRDLPERGRAVYEELFRDRAAIELDLALNGRDETRFRSLLQRYALTDSGRRAARLFARQMFERGDFQQAAYALKRLLDILTEDGTEQLQTVRASIVAELAFCYHRLGMQAPLQALATTNSAICELLVNAGSEKNSLQDYLTYLIGRTPDTVNAPAHTRHLSLPIYSLSNMARPESPQHITASAWSVNPPPPGGKIYNSDFMNYPEPEIPPLLPSVHESLVLVNSGSTLSAYDTMTGANPWPGATPFRATNNSYHLLEPDPNLLLTVSAYRNLAFAALEHPLDSVRQEIKPELRFGFPLYPTFPMVKRALTAVDTGNGRIVWTLGGMYDEDSVSGNEMERFASRVSFHHSFVVDGTLYAVGATREGEAELFLFAADPETGDPLWYVSLCQGQQENTMFGRAGREPLPGIPVYADGVIYICTNLGGVVAVDIGARRVSWVTRYEALPRPITRGQQCYYRKVTFANGAPGLARDKKGNVFLLAAPTDARHLIALNANTGEQLWACEVEKRQSSLNDTTGEAPTVFIGADASYAYVGKGNQLLQIALDDGKVTATFEVGFPVDPRRTAANPLSGRPALCKNEILWPGVYGTCGIPVGNRALDERTAVSRTAPGAVGNLVVRDGMLVCSRGVNYLGRGTGAPTVEARFDFASLLAQLRGQLASGSADAEAHLRYALLASRLIGRDGFSEQDVEKSLKEAVRQSVNHPSLEQIHNTAIRALFRLYLDRAALLFADSKREDMARALNEAGKLASGASEQLDVFRLRESALDKWGSVADRLNFYAAFFDTDQTFEVMISGARLPVKLYSRLMHAKLNVGQGKFPAAIEGVQHILALLPENGEASLYPGLVEWIESIIADHGESVYAAVEKEASEALNRVSGDGAADAARFDIIRRYPNSRAASEAARLICAKAAPEQNATDNATIQKVLDFLSRRRLRDDTVAAWLALHDLHLAREQEVAAYMVIARLKGADQKLHVSYGGKTAALASVLAELEQRYQRPEADTAGLMPLAPPFEDKPSWSVVLPEGSGPAIPAQPKQENELVFLTDSQRGGVIALEASTGKERWRAPLARGRGVTLVEHQDTLVVITISAATGLAIASGEERWSIPMNGILLWHEYVNGLLICMALESDRDDPETASVFAIDCQLGSVAWRANVTSGAGATARVVAGTSLWFASDASGGPRLIEMDMTTGKIVNDASLAARVMGNMALDSAGSLVLPLMDGTLIIIDPKTLAIRHTLQHGMPAVRALFVHGTIAALTSQHDGTFIAFDTGSGHRLWELKPKYKASCSGVWQNGSAINAVFMASSKEFHVVSLDMTKGNWRFDTLVAAPKDASIRVLFASATPFSGGVALMTRRLH